MRVLIAADIFPPESGGPATYAVELANGLARAGVNVAIVSLNPDSDESVLDEKVDLFCVATRFKPLRYWQYYRLLLKYGQDVDLLYAMGPVNAGWPAMRAAKKLGKKFVVKAVGDYAWEQGQVQDRVRDSIDEFQEKQYTGKIGWLKKIEAQVVKNADCVIVPSSYLANMVKGWGAEEKKVKIIYNAVSVKDVDPIQKVSGERWIVSAARLVPWKGMDMLIEIMPEIIKERPETKLKIVGDGPERTKLEFKIKSLNLGHAVELLGNVSHDIALAYIHAGDIFVLNSAYEGLSHVILEALSFNKPVLASRSGGNSEIVMTGKTGELFSYNDRGELLNLIIHFLNTGIIKNDLLRQSERVEFFKQFEHSTMIQKTKEALEFICAN